jgi:hypothetical protein
MSPLHSPLNREPRDRTLLTLGVVMLLLLVALIAMPFVTRVRATAPSRGMTSHTAARPV